MTRVDIMNQNYIKPLDKIVSIKIERKLPPLLVGILYFLCDAVLSFSLLMSAERISAIFLISVINIFLICVLFFYLRDRNKQPKYLSHIELTNMDLALIYKKGKRIANTIVIPLAEIKSFKANFKCTLISRRKGPSFIIVYADLKIKSEGGKIHFIQETKFDFMKDLLQYSVYIPNFSYTLNGNCFSEKPYLKAELEYLARYGKKLPFSEKLINVIYYSTLEEKVMFFLVSVLCFIPVLCLIYFIKTNFFA